MSEYCYLVSVRTPSAVRVVKLNSYIALRPGDLIRLADQQLGEVLAVSYVMVDGDDYYLIASLALIEEDWIEAYGYVGKREKDHDPA